MAELVDEKKTKRLSMTPKKDGEEKPAVKKSDSKFALFTKSKDDKGAAPGSPTSADANKKHAPPPRVAVAPAQGSTPVPAIVSPQPNRPGIVSSNSLGNLRPQSTRTSCHDGK